MLISWNKKTEDGLVWPQLEMYLLNDSLILVFWTCPWMTPYDCKSNSSIDFWSSRYIWANRWICKYGIHRMIRIGYILTSSVMLTVRHLYWTLLFLKYLWSSCEKYFFVTSENDYIFLHFLYIFMQSVTTYLFIFFTPFPTKWLIFLINLWKLRLLEMSALCYMLCRYFSTLLVFLFWLEYLCHI